MSGGKYPIVGSRGLFGRAACEATSTDGFGMAQGEPEPKSLSQQLPELAGVWDEVVHEHELHDLRILPR